MLRCNILSIFLAFSLLAGAQDWKVVRENPQKAFPKTVAAGNYSGIAHLHDDIYAVVSDKSDSALYFNFRILVNPKTGELEQVENLGFTERTDGTLNDGKSWQGQEKGFDHEAIVKVSDSTLVIASEGYCRLKEYPILPTSADAAKVGSSQNLWESRWPSSEFYPNYNFESLAFDFVRQYLWTIPESTLRKDGQPATPQNGLANRLRLMRLDWGKIKENRNKEEYSEQVSSKKDSCYMTPYAYQMDQPSTHKKADIYVMGVSELCALPDGQLLVLEREAFIPKIKIGAFCKCKLYLINPLNSEEFSMKENFSSDTPFLKKRLLAEWKTGLSLSKRSFANYEGLCLGPKLEDGSQVVILLSDSQDQYAGVLKDWFKTIVIRKE
ncbi:esterase-like activity of phytase family protein [Prevotella copri]|uniref:esterase-like activity of phytase family protein n=1 Tax=Segatella copri TaxID=165179 RepID=UPI001C2B940F|nr:esterase-like activity of phytase family protein [Segatella copri]MBU9908916.1 esterase-like activity of phytase family protein [Segatella copri]MBV3374364.1 esterase-like activity of phytase family protein [Segatella copri]